MKTPHRIERTKRRKAAQPGLRAARRKLALESQQPRPAALRHYKARPKPPPQKSKWDCVCPACRS